MLEKTINDICELCKNIKNNEQRLKDHVLLSPSGVQTYKEQIKFLLTLGLPMAMILSSPVCSSQITECFGDFHLAIYLFIFHRFKAALDADTSREEAAIKESIAQGYAQIIHKFWLIYDKEDIPKTWGFVKNVLRVIEKEISGREASTLSLRLANALLILNEQRYIRENLKKLITLLAYQIKPVRKKENNLVLFAKSSPHVLSTPPLLLLPENDIEKKHFHQNESPKSNQKIFPITSGRPAKLKTSISDDGRCNKNILNKIKKDIKNKKSSDLETLFHSLMSTAELQEQLNSLSEYVQRNKQIYGIKDIHTWQIIVDIIKKYQQIHSLPSEERQADEKYNSPWNRYAENKKKEYFNLPLVQRALRLKLDVESAVNTLENNLKSKMQYLKKEHQKFAMDSDTVLLNFPRSRIESSMRCMQLMELFKIGVVCLYMGGLCRDTHSGKIAKDIDAIINLNEKDTEQMLRGLRKNHHIDQYEFKPYTDAISIVEVTYQEERIEFACDSRLTLKSDGSLDMNSLQTIADSRDLNINTIAFDTYGNIYDVYEVGMTLMDAFIFGNIRPFIQLPPGIREEVVLTNYMEDWPFIFQQLQLQSPTIDSHQVELNLRKLIYDPSIYIKLLEKIQCEKVDIRLLDKNLAVLFLNPIPKLIIQACCQHEKKILKASLLFFEKLLRSIVEESAVKFPETTGREDKKQSNCASHLKRGAEVRQMLNRPFYRNLLKQFLTSGGTNKKVPEQWINEALDCLLCVNVFSGVSPEAQPNPGHTFLFERMMANYDKNRKLNFLDIAAILATTIYLSQRKEPTLPTFKSFEAAIKNTILNIPFLSQFYARQINKTGEMKLALSFYADLKKKLAEPQTISMSSYWHPTIRRKPTELTLAPGRETYQPS